jgi:hypothetical protein
LQLVSWLYRFKWAILTQKYDELQRYGRDFYKDAHTLEITAIMRKCLTVIHKSAEMLLFWKWFARRSRVERREAFGGQDEIEIISPSNLELRISDWLRREIFLCGLSESKNSHMRECEVRQHFWWLGCAPEVCEVSHRDLN